MAAQQPRDRQFKVLKFVGKGSYGSVFLVQRLADGQTYALKEMDVRSMSQAEREDSINEIRLLASVSHPNVISYNEAFLDGNRLCIIMEYAADGDLAKVIKRQQQKRPLPEDVIWRYFIQVVMGLQALHNMKILHRDIKPGNIMVFESGVVKIGDLGIAKLLTKTAAAKTQIGTPHYMGPEIWKNRPYSYTSDTWAIGCLLYELATLAVPFEARSMSELRYKVLRGTYPPIPNAFSRDLQQLVRECLDPNPDKRPSMDAILAMPAVVSRLKLLPTQARNPPQTAGSALVDTIKVPRGNIAAIKNKLPPAQYATDMLNMPAGGPGGHGQMATIEEGNEDEAPPSRPAGGQGQGGGGGRQPSAPAPPQQRPPVPMGALPPMPKPHYPPPPSHAGMGKLPALGAGPSAAASEAGYGNQGGGGGARAPPSQGGASAWSYGGGGGGAGGAGGQAAPGHPARSESHSNYGAFYHQQAYTPNGVAAPRPPPSQAQAPQAPLPPVAPWQAGNKWPPIHIQQQLQQQAARAAYISPYGQQYQQQQQAAAAVAAAAAQQAYQAYGGGGGGVPHLPQLNAQQRAGLAAVAGRAPPPWNYGVQQQQAAAAAAGRKYAAAPRGLPSRPGGGGGLDGQQGELPRYPPPQWAPRPARW